MVFFHRQPPYEEARRERSLPFANSWRFHTIICTPDPQASQVVCARDDGEGVGGYGGYGASMSRRSLMVWNSATSIEVFRRTWKARKIAARDPLTSGDDGLGRVLGGFDEAGSVGALATAAASSSSAPGRPLLIVWCAAGVDSRLRHTTLLRRFDEALVGERFRGGWVELEVFASYLVVMVLMSHVPLGRSVGKEHRRTLPH